MKSISLWLCGSLRLCGGTLRALLHHRGTENSPRHRVNKSLSVTVLALFVFPASHFTQGQTKRNDRPKSEAAAASDIKTSDNDPTRYTWEFAQPQFTVNHIVIEHDAVGHGKVSFDRKAEEETI